MQTLTELNRRRTQILARLDDPNLSDVDTATLAAEGESVALGIAAHRQRERLLTGEPTRTSGEQRTADPVPTSLAAGVRAFADSDQVAAFRQSGYVGRVGVEFPALDTRALIDTGLTSGGAFQNPSRPSEVYALTPDRAPRVVDLLDQRSTDANNQEWVQDTSTVGVGGSGLAAEVAEGALKPESTYSFTVVSDPVRTVAHWINITRQALDDSTALAQHVEGRLMYGLDARLDAQVLTGTGTAPNLRGILNTTGVGTYVAAAGEAAVISVRRAISVAQASEINPDGLVLNPSDWERIELSTDTSGTFRVSPNVTGAMAPRLWGLRVVATTAMTALTFLVGAFQQGATLWRRSSALFVTDAHASNFTSNILTLLAEQRVALSVTSPKAFVKGTFSTGTA